MTMKIAFRVIPHLSYGMTVLVSNKKATGYNIFGQDFVTTE